MYCSVMSAIGMSVIDTSLTRIRWSSRSSGPLKAAIATGGRTRSEVSSGITAPATAARRRAPSPSWLRPRRGRAASPAWSTSRTTSDGAARSSARRCAERFERRVEVADQVLLAVDAAARRRAALQVHDRDLVGRRVEHVEREEVAVVGLARVLAPRAGRVRHHRHDLLADGLRRLRDADRVAVRLRHLAAVDAVDLRRRGEERLRLREDLAVESVEPAHDLAADLEVARLVLPDRHEVRAVDGDVGGHQHGIPEEAVGAEVAGAQLLDLVLVGRHALEPAERRDHREVERELGVLRHPRLQEDRRLLRIEADRQPVEHRLAGVRGERPACRRSRS